MAPYWSEEWGNPSSRQHRLGLTASAAVKLARRQIAEALALTPQRLVFTSGATEANNLALLGHACLLYTSPSPRDATLSRMPSSA